MAALAPIFSQTSDKNVSNTTVETSLIGTGIGRTLLLPNELYYGRRIRFELDGFFSRQNGNITLRFKLGTTVIVATASSTSGAASNNSFKIEVTMTVRASGVTGNVIAQGSFKNMNTFQGLEMVSITTENIDTTISQNIDLTLQFSRNSAGNSFTSTNCDIKLLN